MRSLFLGVGHALNDGQGLETVLPNFEDPFRRSILDKENSYSCTFTVTELAAQSAAMGDDVAGPVFVTAASN
jgi:hypothetical protein